MKNLIIKSLAAAILVAGATQAHADFITRPDFGKKSQFDVKPHHVSSANAATSEKAVAWGDTDRRVRTSNAVAAVRG